MRLLIRNPNDLSMSAMLTPEQIRQVERLNLLVDFMTASMTPRRSGKVVTRILAAESAIAKACDEASLPLDFIHPTGKGR